MFDKATAPNSWRITSRLLREYIEFFSPKTEQLDFLAKDGKAIFTSFTEKVMDGKQILKQPLETAITIHVEDFEDFDAEKDVHITISVKDFKAVVMHAETLKGSITAYFSRPSRPLQFFYQALGMTCQFTLMTRGDITTTSTSGTPAPQRVVSNRTESRQASRQASVAPLSGSRQPSMVPQAPEQASAAVPIPVSRQTTEDMPPPPKPVTMSALRERRLLIASNRLPSQATTASDRDPESLFMPRDDEEERQWDPLEFEEQEAEEKLGWDANAEIVGVLV